jgi:hypothetical protein
MHSTVSAMTKQAMTLFCVLLALFGMSAGRPAQAASLYLSPFEIRLNLRYSNGTIKQAQLFVTTQNSAGDFTGWMLLGSTWHTVQGNITDSYAANWYWFRFSAVNHSLYGSTRFNFNGWVYKHGGGVIQLGWGDFQWSSELLYHYWFGSGKFDGWGVVPPR